MSGGLYDLSGLVPFQGQGVAEPLLLLIAMRKAESSAWFVLARLARIDDPVENSVPSISADGRIIAFECYDCGLGFPAKKSAHQLFFCELYQNSPHAQS